MNKKFKIVYNTGNVSLCYHIDSYLIVGEHIVFLDDKTGTRRRLPTLFCMIEEQVKP